MKPTAPMLQTSNNAVRIPALARSAFVGGRRAVGSALSCEEVPAAGFPWLVPPVVLVTSAGAKLRSVDWMTESADICWPTPELPS